MAQAKSTDNAPSPEADPLHNELTHVLPMHVLVGVFVALLVFTVVTVAATYVDLGEANIWLALGIATIKAGLVALYFMHLRYDHPYNGLVLLVALLFVALFIGTIIVDTSTPEYQQELSPPRTMTP